MKKIIISILCLIILLPELFANWHDENGDYMMKIIPKATGVATMVDLGKMLLPCDLGNGVSVYDKSGKKMYHSLSQKDYVLFIGPVCKDEPLFIYFGLKEKKTFNNWPRKAGIRPKFQPLQLTVIEAWLKNRTGKEVLEYREKAKNRRKLLFENRQKLINKQLDQLLKEKGKASAKEDLKIDKLIEVEKELLREKNKILVEKEDLKIVSENLRWKNEDRSIENFFKLNGDIQGVKAIDKILFTKSPFTNRNVIAAMFKGNLKITTPGIYTFAINSDQGSYITIDGDVVVSWLNNHPKSLGWEKRAEIRLEKGVYDFRYYYQTNKREKFASAAWKQPGMENFNILEASNFSNPFGAKIVTCIDKKNNIFPIIKFKNRGTIILENEQHASWIECENLNPDTYWSFGDFKIPVAEQSQFLIKDKESFITFACSSESQKFKSFPVLISTKPNVDKRIDMELELKLWTPDFIYDDEVLGMDIEVCNGTRGNVKLVLRTKATIENAIFKSDTEWLNIDKKSMNIYAPSRTFKRNITLDGSKMIEALEVDYSIYMPPLKIDSQILKFLSITDCGGLIEAVDGLIDSNGAKVIPLLHRKTLAEKRTWALAKAIMREFISPKKVIIISDNFGQPNLDFRKALTDELIKNEISLEFIEWNEKAFGSYMYASIGNAVEKINKSQAELALIIPSSRDSEAGIPIRHQKRSVAAILEVLQKNKNITTIALTTPFPTLKGHELATTLSSDIHQLSREYETEYIDLNKYIKSITEWEKGYRLIESSASVMENYPVQLIPEIVTKILSALKIR